ncbi:hypothetical protein ARMGADRAFT_732231 [Armillaria gallica]|uniref:Uncharacterized protein n=1 Tax=Armillaria gallica TaxID=47427 RepID=A0A2H3CTM9_ARMGA|nr:hypothetical protein ARMGADRAFT_732231 [Armillaria gallica]
MMSKATIFQWHKLRVCDDLDIQFFTALMAPLMKSTAKLIAESQVMDTGERAFRACIVAGQGSVRICSMPFLSMGTCLRGQTSR